MSLLSVESMECGMRLGYDTRECDLFFSLFVGVALFMQFPGTESRAPIVLLSA